ncbi:protein FAR1-RELATED SEQUENCE 5-like [Vicia villosa]|uniref:protein FAR1-RELATED SEQUENCE 5-like n=1 Tax=Vicia villosa TaxID=3911 RepID=UPI00273BA041|nr:protein FAR1-RELATED SEQUENCE 5-like [Vicia villosa]
MFLNFVQLKNILATLKRKEPDNISNIRQVYNQRHRNNKASRGYRNKMQQLLKMLDDNKYVSRYRNYDDEVTVRDIFWTHQDSIKFFNTFSTVLLLDSIYKTNKYRLPLFEMVGVTSTEKNFAVGFSFLKCEKEDNFRWALEVCWSLSDRIGFAW